MELGLGKIRSFSKIISWGAATKATRASRAFLFVVLCRFVVDATGLLWKAATDIAKLQRNLLK
jgi:predicted exporter